MRPVQYQTICRIKHDREDAGRLEICRDLVSDLDVGLRIIYSKSQIELKTVMIGCS